MKCLIALAALLVAPLAQAAPPPPPPCDAAAYHQFDFWIGDWDMVDGAGNRQGGNRITREEMGCLLIEHWVGVSGAPDTGQSFNFYDPIKKTWHQTWVAPGGIIEFDGALDDKGQMVLEGDNHGRGGKAARTRGTWIKNADGTVTQRFERWDEAKKAWAKTFEGIYRKKA